MKFLSALPLLVLSVVVFSTVSCKVDQSALRKSAIEAMNPVELIYFRENQVRIREKDELSALARDAARQGYLNVLKYLHALGENINAPDERGWNATLLASERGDLNTLRFLVEHTGTDVRAKTDQRMTSLMLAAKNGHLETCLYLLDRGANINARSGHGHTALMFAAASGSKELVTRFVEQGATLNSKDESGANAADYAPDKTTRNLLAELGLKPALTQVNQ